MENKDFKYRKAELHVKYTDLKKHCKKPFDYLQKVYINCGF